ncbi:MAG: MoxR family ATPase [Clostridia bacterium]|nr:MoxR family ATPase [Clostridia bacterium]
MRPEMAKVLAETEKVISGKRDVIQMILTALLADGHVLLDDVPGVGKTNLAVAISRAIQMNYRRVQFTPDVLPSDLTGFSMIDRQSGGFVYHAGALNDANLLLGDEINRASSRTQSALLEAMEERQVTVDGTTYPLRKPFCVIATQNSIGAAGTQFLPFAQVDRFLVRLSLGYPDYAAQMEMLRNRQGVNPLEQVQRVMSGEELAGLQKEVQQVASGDAVLDYITRLTLASREHEAVAVGISPRGALFLDRMSKAYAFLDDRDYVTGKDVRAVFRAVCAHRILLKEDAQKTVNDVLDDLMKTVENPDRHSRGNLRK